MTPPPSDAALVDKAVRDFGRLIPGGAVSRRSDGVAMVVTGLPSPFFNSVWALAGASREALDAVLASVRSAGVPFSLYDAGASGLADVAEAHDLIAAELPLPVLGCDHPIGAPARGGVRIEAVTPRTVEVHQRLLVDGFGMPAPMAARIGAGELFADPAVRGYVALLDGEPAATGISILDGALAYVYSVVTAPGARRRGLATVLMGAIVDEALSAGADWVCLEPTADGEPLYRGLGFVEVACRPRFVFEAPNSSPEVRDALARG